ncbi:uncharacterized protein LOC134828109 [Culicoides brevitarsis]|uniref:uncharacterized protein LOC134828109 n=1 Tax=Culicoides brevitarsis TaxID=469753 RepID=UPI00307BD3AF
MKIIVLLFALCAFTATCNASQIAFNTESCTIRTGELHEYFYDVYHNYGPGGSNYYYVHHPLAESMFPYWEHYHGMYNHLGESVVENHYGWSEEHHKALVTHVVHVRQNYTAFHIGGIRKLQDTRENIYRNLSVVMHSIDALVCEMDGTLAMAREIMMSRMECGSEDMRQYLSNHAQAFAQSLQDFFENFRNSMYMHYYYYIDESFMWDWQNFLYDSTYNKDNPVESLKSSEAIYFESKNILLSKQLDNFRTAIEWYTTTKGIMELNEIRSRLPDIINNAATQECVDPYRYF